MFSKPRNRAIFALIIANVIWGAASPIFKFSLENIPPFTLAFIRFFFASLLILPLARNCLCVAKADWIKLILASIFGVSINISFFFMGLKLSSAITMPIIASAGPMFLYLFALLTLHEKASFKVLTGLAISLTGVILIIFLPIFQKGIDATIIGNLFFVISVFGSIAYTLIAKGLLEKYRALTITFWSFVVGTVSFFPLFLYEYFTSNPFTTLDYRGATGIIFGIFLSSTLAYLLYIWGIKRIPAQEVGVFFYVDPIAAVIIAVPLLGEAITPLYIFGSLLVFLGIFIAEGRLHYHPLHKLSN